MNGTIVSLNVGQPRLVTYRGMSFRTGIFKDPIDKPQLLKKLNFTGDGQADLSAHGGIDKAVYCYPIEHYAFWQNQTGRAVLPMGNSARTLRPKAFSKASFGSATFFAWAPPLCRSRSPGFPATSL